MMTIAVVNNNLQVDYVSLETQLPHLTQLIHDHEHFQI
jgi:hypothetical protein